MAIGLLAHCAHNRIFFVGNGAGHGACLALMDVAKRTEAEQVTRRVEHVELAKAKGFGETFLASTVLGPLPLRP